MEDASPHAVRSGVLDAPSHSCGRSRSTGQRRRLPGGRLRSRFGQGDLARQLHRRLLERAAAGLRQRARLHRHWFPGAVADRGSPRRHRRRDADAHRLDAAPLGAAHTFTDRRRRRALRRQRHGDRDVPRQPHRRDDLARTSRRQLLGVAGVRRRTDLFPERGRGRDGARAGQDVPQAGRQRARRRNARIDGDRRSVDLHPDGQRAVSPRRSCVRHANLEGSKTEADGSRVFASSWLPFPCYFARGFGLTWNFTTFGFVPLPPS